MALPERCIRCKRFVGEDAIGVINPDLATPHDPDGWTGTYVCAPGKGCHPGFPELVLVVHSDEPYEFFDPRLAA